MNALTPYVSMAVAALVIICLLLVGLLVYRTLSRTVRGRRGARLGISEFHEIDKSRRLILVRRDDVEHLLLIGGEQDIVVETNIESGLYSAPARPVANAPQPPQMAGNIQAMPLRPPPRPPVFGERRTPLRSVDPIMPLPANNDDE